MLTTPAEFLTSEQSDAHSRICRLCGSGFIVPEFVSTYVANLANICPECCEADARERARLDVEKSNAVRFQRWQRICPPDFQATDRNRIPCQRQLAAVMRWDYGPMGLLLFGHSGRGKSRCAWLLLRREFDAGRSIAAMDSASGFDYASRFADGTDAASRWLERRCSVDVLLLDDIFKAKLTDSFEAAIFAVIATRTERRLPLIVTTNDTGNTLLGRMSQDRGGAMMRRLREFCLPIAFTS